MTSVINRKHTDRLFQSCNCDHISASLPFSPESPLLSVEVVLAASDIVVPREQSGLHKTLKSVQKDAISYLHTFRKCDNTTDPSRPVSSLFGEPLGN